MHAESQVGKSEKHSSHVEVCHQCTSILYNNQEAMFSCMEKIWIRDEEDEEVQEEGVV
jgi:hypothetical protein